MGLSRFAPLLADLATPGVPPDAGETDPDVDVTIYAMMAFSYLLGKTDSRIFVPYAEWHDDAILLTWSRRGLYLEVEVSPDRPARAVFLPQDPAQSREGEWTIGDPLPDWLAGVLPDFYDTPEQGEPG